MHSRLPICEEPRKRPHEKQDCSRGGRGHARLTSIRCPYLAPTVSLLGTSEKTAYGIMRSQAPDGADGVYMAINYISDIGISVFTE